MARILFLTSSYPSSPEDGVCGFIDDLARTLVESHGHSVRVLAPPGDLTGFEPVEVRAVGHPWPFARRLLAGADLGAAVRGSRAGQSEAVSLTLALAGAAFMSRSWADVTISHWLTPSAVAASLAGIRRHVAVAHGGDVHLLAGLPAGRQLARFVVVNADRIVCVSDDLGRRLVSLAPAAASKLDVIPMGARLGPEPNPPEVRAFLDSHSTDGSTRVLFLGRLQPIKGVDVLIEAASRVPGIDLWIAGDGPEHARLLEQAQAARLRVSFLGRIDRRERRVALAACDVVAIPSRIEQNGRMEGTPVVCAESYVSGRPVIATRTGGLVDAVEDGKTGLLVPPDDAEALAHALRRFSTDPELGRRLAEGARAVAPRFDMATTAAAFDTIVADVIEANRSTRG